MKDVSHPFQLRDGRTPANGEGVDRVIVSELGVAEPYVLEGDTYVRAPLRISHNAAAGYVLEVGDMDFSDSDFTALENAVNEMRRIIDSGQ